MANWEEEPFFFRGNQTSVSIPSMEPVIASFSLKPSEHGLRAFDPWPWVWWVIGITLLLVLVIIMIKGVYNMIFPAPPGEICEACSQTFSHPPRGEIPNSE